MPGVLATRLADIHRQAFEGTERVWGRGWSATEIADLAAAPGGILLVAGDQDPAGFALLRKVVDEAELLTIAVEPKQWNLGIARALLKSAMLYLATQGCVTITLEAATGNDRAMRLYRSVGFEAVGQRAGYYKSGSSGDACILRRSLSR